MIFIFSNIRDAIENYALASPLIVGKDFYCIRNKKTKTFTYGICINGYYYNFCEFYYGDPKIKIIVKLILNGKFFNIHFDFRNSLLKLTNAKIEHKFICDQFKEESLIVNLNCFEDLSIFFDFLEDSKYFEKLKEQ